MVTFLRGGGGGKDKLQTLAAFDRIPNDRNKAVSCGNAMLESLEIILGL